MYLHSNTVVVSLTTLLCIYSALCTYHHDAFNFSSNSQIIISFSFLSTIGGDCDVEQEEGNGCVSGNSGQDEVGTYLEVETGLEAADAATDAVSGATVMMMASRRGKREIVQKGKTYKPIAE